MPQSKQKRLFGEFPPVSTAQWEEVIAKDLKGADYDKKLVWKSSEGFSVRPYYRAEDLRNVRHLASEPGCFPYVRGTGKCNRWRVHQTLQVDDPAVSNTLALKVLEGGVDSLGFQIMRDGFSSDDLDTLLKGVYLEAIELVFCGCATRQVAQLVLDKLNADNTDPDQIRISFLIDPILKDFSLNGNNIDGSFAEIAALAKRFAPYKKVRVAGVNGQHFHNSGSTIVQELAFTLAAGHEYVVRLMENGLSVDEAARTIRFSMAVSSNYFMEIAKFRAARMLWANILKPYAPARGCSSKMRVHAATSRWNMTAYDPYVNMLRGTTEAMSASIAGVHSLEVLPFDTPYASPDDFSRRIARNVQLLLKHESHVDEVADPSGGSYYIETLTQSIADQAWKLFREVEDRGGYLAAFREGFIQDAVEASAAAKNKAVATRRITLLGTNQYPNFSEIAPEAISESTVTPSCTPHAAIRTLRPYRGAMAFEQMRLRTDRSGKQPKAFMLTCGTLAFARARAQFSSNFFGCAGIRVIDNTFFASVEEGAKAALASGAEIVVVCAADDDYATLAPLAHKLIGDRAIVVVAGDPTCRPELEAHGITHFISIRSNVLETLQSYLNELNI